MIHPFGVFSQDPRSIKKQSFTMIKFKIFRYFLLKSTSFNNVYIPFDTKVTIFYAKNVLDETC